MTRETTPTAALTAVTACQSRPHIWRNDTGSSAGGRKVSRLRNVSTIHSVRKAKLPTKEQYDSKAEAKSLTEPEAAAPPVASPAAQPAPLPADPPSEQPIPTTKQRRKHRLMSKKAETLLRRSVEEFYGYYQDKPRARFEDKCKSTSHLSSAEAEFEGIRLATKIHEWYRARVPEEE